MIGTPKFNSKRTIAMDSAVIAALTEHRKAQLAAGQRSSIIFAGPDDTGSPTTCATTATYPHSPTPAYPAP